MDFPTEQLVVCSHKLIMNNTKINQQNNVIDNDTQKTLYKVE